MEASGGGGFAGAGGDPGWMGGKTENQMDLGWPAVSNIL